MKSIAKNIVSLAASFGLRIVRAECRSEYDAAKRETAFALKSDTGLEFLVERVTGEPVCSIVHWGTSRTGWGAQRITGRDGDRYLESAHIYLSESSLPKLLTAIAERESAR